MHMLQLSLRLHSSRFLAPKGRFAATFFKSNGLQPTSDGLQPTSDDLQAMASNLLYSECLQPNSKGLQKGLGTLLAKMPALLRILWWQ